MQLPILKYFKFITTIIISSFFQNNIYIWGQNEPIELWSGIDLDFPVVYGVSIRATKEIRSNLSEKLIKSDINDIGISYRIFPWWRVSSYYRWKIREKSNINGLYFSSNFTQSSNRFDFKYRIRYDSKGFDLDKDNQQIRQKLCITYNLSKKISFSIEADLFYNINIQRFNNIRYIFTTDIATMKRQSIELYFMHENEFNIEKPESKFVFGISYQIKTLKLIQ